MTGVLIGIDSSTQACKVAVVDARTGLPLASGYAPHPDRSAVDPRLWLEALRKAWDMAGVPARRDILDIGVSAQQHGMVAIERFVQRIGRDRSGRRGRQFKAALTPTNESGAEQYRARYRALRSALTDGHP